MTPILSVPSSFSYLKKLSGVCNHIPQVYSLRVISFFRERLCSPLPRKANTQTNMHTLAGIINFQYMQFQIIPLVSVSDCTSFVIVYLSLSVCLPFPLQRYLLSSNLCDILRFFQMDQFTPGLSPLIVKILDLIETHIFHFPFCL